MVGYPCRRGDVLGALVENAAGEKTGPGTIPLSAAEVFAGVAADYDPVHGPGKWTQSNFHRKKE